MLMSQIGYIQPLRGRRAMEIRLRRNEEAVMGRRSSSLSYYMVSLCIA